MEVAAHGGFKKCGLYRKVVDKRATGHDVMEAAREGDELGVKALASFAEWLGRGLSIVADVMDPGLVVLGGGVSADADLFMEDAKDSLRRNMVGSGYRPVPEILCAELGPQAGMIGVADLAREDLAGRQRA